MRRARRLPRGLRSPLAFLLVTWIAAGCGGTPATPAGRQPKSAGRADASAVSNAPRLWDRACRLVTTVGTPAVQRTLTARWQETLVPGADGRLASIALAPRGAWVSERDAQGEKPVSLDMPEGIDFKRDPEGAGPLVSVLPGRLGAGASDAWRGRMVAFLLLEETAWASRPPKTAASKGPWPIRLEAEAFAERTRLGAWPEPVTLVGEVGLLPHVATAASPGYLALVEVRFAKAQVLRLEIRCALGEEGDLVAAEVRGTPLEGSVAPEESPFRSEFLWQLRRLPVSQEPPAPPASSSR
ncbi:MAG: hypothetical protein HYZ53_14935 [Planctomycetes bacterium]|nr:hypothetical protein [Planctomycetota bacterium]